MVHNSVPKENSDKPYTQRYAELQRIESLYRSRTKVPAAWYPMTGGTEYYINATQALKYGIIDQIKP